MMQWYSSSCRHGSTCQRQFLWAPGTRQPQLTAKGGQLFFRKLFPSESRPLITCKHNKVEARTQQMTHKPCRESPDSADRGSGSQSADARSARHHGSPRAGESDGSSSGCQTYSSRAASQYEPNSKPWEQVSDPPAQRFPAPANHRVRGQVGSFMGRGQLRARAGWSPRRGGRGRRRRRKKGEKGDIWSICCVDEESQKCSSMNELRANATLTYRYT